MAGIGQILQISINLAILGLLLYAWVYVIPDFQSALKKCEERLLCQRGELKGAICQQYAELDEIAKNFSMPKK